MTLFIESVNRGDLDEVTSEYNDDIPKTMLHSAMLSAVTNNNIAIVTFLLTTFKHGLHNENIRTFDSTTLLMIAVNHEYYPMIHLLLNYVNINDIDYIHGNTALMNAVLNNNLPMVQYLLSKNADVNIQSVSGHSALMYAIVHDYQVIANVLVNPTRLDIHSRFYTYPLTIAIDRNNTFMIKMMLQYPEKLGNSLYRAMYICVNLRNLNLLELFLEMDIPNQIKHKSFFLCIVKNQWIEGLELFLKYPYDVNESDKTKETALHIAISNKNVRIMKMLIDHGADVNIVLPGGLSPLAHACLREHSFEEVMLLIDYGADVNKLSENPNHPESNLLMAISAGNYELIPMLLLRGSTIPDVKTLQLCLESISFHHNYVQTCETIKDIILACQSTPTSILKDIFSRKQLQCTTWTKLLLFNTKFELQKYIHYNIKDQFACYTAVFEGEDAVLKKYRQGELVNFAPSKLRGIMRPMGNRHVRKLLVSYLIHPTKMRHLLSAICV
jgi:ankyrin repeat protein